MYDDDPKPVPTFFLFAGYRYYPDGGMRDFRDSFKTLEDAEAAWDKSEYDWANVAEITPAGLVEVATFRR